MYTKFAALVLVTASMAACSVDMKAPDVGFNPVGGSSAPKVQQLKVGTVNEPGENELSTDRAGGTYDFELKSDRTATLEVRFSYESTINCDLDSAVAKTYLVTDGGAPEEIQLPKDIAVQTGHDYRISVVYPATSCEGIMAAFTANWAN